MQKLAFWIVLVSLVVACSEKSKDINKDDEIETVDFISSFPEKTLPIQFNYKDLIKQENDSFFLKPAVVEKFIPDSIFNKEFSKIKNIRFFRKAKYKAEETEETYLFLAAEGNNKKAIYLICFNEKNEFATGMKLLEKSAESNVTMEGGLDKRLTIIKTKNKETKDKKSYYEKSAFVYNTEGVFTLILTESNAPIEKQTVYNPIDTMERKNPLSGDYKIDDKNFVSIRDASKAGKLQFFINIEKPGGKCNGSFRGDLVQIKPKIYHYSKADDHCVMEFSFTGKRVQIRELEACGNHRGVRCTFDGKFNKK